MKKKWHFYQFLSGIHPVRLVALGYLSYVVIGWLFLSLPFSQTNNSVSALDTLFVSASAVSTTGLQTVSTGNDFSTFGQVVILLLIQLGGLGYMTFGSFVTLSRSATLSERRKDVGKTVFSLPKEFNIDKFIVSVILFSVFVESFGTLSLYWFFNRAGVNNPLWSAIFHSVSAFCTAGFSLYDNSLEQFRNNVPINSTLGILSYLGALGFIVFIDVGRHVTGKTTRLTLTSRIIVVTTAWLSVAGFLLFYRAIRLTQVPTICSV